MQYLYHLNSGDNQLILRGDEHHYIFKVRRHRQNEIIALRNLEDNVLYLYKISSIDKKEAYLELIEERELQVIANKKLHIGWCLIDLKNIEKILPTLNEIGVEQITFISCKRSQQNVKVDFERLNRILLNSSQQCGRSSMMNLEISNSLEDFLVKYPKSHILNFSQNYLSNSGDIETVVIGCEGGFSDSEIKLFGTNKILGFDTPLILRSESAVCAVASKILI